MNYCALMQHESHLITFLTSIKLKWHIGAKVQDILGIIVRLFALVTRR